MRRIIAFLAAAALVLSLSGSSLAASGRSSFQGDFDLWNGDGTLAGHATAQLSQPTNQRLVPGRFDFNGAPTNEIRESHAQFGNAHFWYDPDFLPAGATIPGANVARGEGVECVYRAPNAAVCQWLVVQFVDSVDPTVRDEVQFYGPWGEVTQFVGNGSFTLRFSGTES